MDRRLQRLLAGVLLTAGAFGVALHDLMNANRPHELHKAPIVALLAAAACVAATAAWWRLRPRSGRDVALVVVAGLLDLVALFLLVAASSNVIRNLG
jgi:hypothetical protein